MCPSTLRGLSCQPTAKSIHLKLSPCLFEPPPRQVWCLHTVAYQSWGGFQIEAGLIWCNTMVHVLLGHVLRSMSGPSQGITSASHGHTLWWHHRSTQYNLLCYPRLCWQWLGMAFLKQHVRWGMASPMSVHSGLPVARWISDRSRAHLVQYDGVRAPWPTPFDVEYTDPRYNHRLTCRAAWDGLGQAWLRECRHNVWQHCQPRCFTRIHAWKSWGQEFLQSAMPCRWKHFNGTPQGACIVSGHWIAHVGDWLEYVRVNSNEVSLELVNEEFPDANNEHIKARDAQPPHREGIVTKPSPSPVPETDDVVLINDDILHFIKALLTMLIGKYAHLLHMYCFALATDHAP